MFDNIILLSDSYKYSHGAMLLDNTENVYSYFEARKGSQFDSTIFYGLQAILKKYFVGQVVSKEKIDETERIINAHFGMGIFNREGWEYILEKYNGHLPLRIKAVKEGSNIPVGNVLLTVENLDSECAWLTNFCETILTHIWYPTTVATLSYNCKKMLQKFLEETSSLSKKEQANVLAFQLHDFGFRGVETVGAAALGGSAHLLNFMGTDTVPALMIPSRYYNEESGKLYGYSVRATEHSIMTSRGKDGEFEVVKALLDKNPAGIMSMVIDSYDYQQFLLTCGTKFKDQIVNRDGRIVFRPDSGDIIDVSQTCLTILGECFGYSVNDKGFKVLPPQVRVLWGDGIDLNGISRILTASKENGWSSENWVFGMGGGLLQKVNRDVCRFAFKCSSQYYDGKWNDVQKVPRDKSKASKAGRLALIQCGNNYRTIREEEIMFKDDNLLDIVFENGILLRDDTFDNIKARIH